MDDTQFDRLTQTLSERLSRRRVGGIAASLLALSLGAADIDAKKKKKKKGEKKKAPSAPAAACQFTKIGATWTLQSDCTSTTTIALPDGVTLNGNGKRITLAGAGTLADPERVAAAGILVQNGTATVRNLTLIDELAGCSGPGSSIAFEQASGTVDNVVFKGSNSCRLAAVSVSNDLDRPVVVDIVDSTFEMNVSGSYEQTIGYTGAISGTISGNRLSCTGNQDRCLTGIDLRNIQAMTIEANLIEGYETTVLLYGTEELCTVRNNALAPRADGVRIYYDASADVLDNTITRTGLLDTSAPPFGVDYGSDAFGTVAGNTIANFFGDRACGIRAPAGQVTIGTDNTFPAPGNRQDICVDD